MPAGFVARLQQTKPDLLRVLRLARFEFQLAMVSFRAALSPQQRRRREALRNAVDLKVQIGSGANKVPGWVNIDAGSGADIQLDLRRRLPFSDGSVSCIFTEHFLDHLDYPDGIHHVLSECRRVLKPGGVMRGIVHDAERLMRAYLEKDEAFFREIGALDPKLPHVPTRAAAVNHLFRFNGFHQFMYDYETLAREFTRAGFSSVRRSDFRASEVPELNLDLDLFDRAPQSLYIEAVR